MAVGIDQFIRRILESSVLSQDEITSLWATLPAEKQPADGEALARMLVKEKKLTKYQAEQIYAGKGKHLVLGNYVILDKIGAGGMGQVFKARHKRMNRLVAIKLLPPELNKDETTIQRFHREVQAAAKLTHPNIVIAYDADEAPGGVHFLVMEYVAGKDLAHLLAQENILSISQALNYVLQAAKGLAYAHENGVVHRDIKPANLLLDEKGTIKILDMGLARLNDAAAHAAKEGLTKSGDVMGTVDYMAPEQAFDTHSVDERADIYSLGCTLFRLLTKQNVYDAETIVQKLMAHQTKPIPVLMQRRNDVSAELQQVFEKMVAKRVEDRYQSMDEVIAALQAIYYAINPSHAQQNSKSDSKLKDFFRKFTGSGATKPGNDAPTSAIVSPDEPHVGIENPALEATINLSNSAQVTDPVSDRSIHAVRSLAPQPLAKKQPAGPGWRNRNVWLAAGAGGFLLLMFAVWVIIKDKNGNEIARVQVPEGGSTTMLEEPPKSSTPAPTVPATHASPEKPATTRWPFDPPDGKEYTWSEPENLGNAVNTATRDLAPQLTSDELTMLFNRASELFLAERSHRDEPFLKTQPLPDSINKLAGLSENATISGDGLTILFARGESRATRDIWMVERPSKTEPFGAPVKLPEPVNTKYNEHVPILSADGLWLCLGATRAQRWADSDIYYYHRKSRQEPFAEETNAGQHVNRIGFMTPGWISSDGKTLLACSIHTSGNSAHLHQRASITEPFGKGIPLAPELSGDYAVENGTLSADGQRLYFHSRRIPKGVGDLDIWMIRRQLKTADAAKAPVSAAKIPAEALTFNGHRYLLVAAVGSTWEEARIKAEQLGGHLVTINSQAERDWVRDQLWLKRPQPTDADQCYLGGRINEKRTSGTWITNEPFDMNLWDGELKPGTLGRVIVLTAPEGRWDEYRGKSNKDTSHLLVEWELLEPTSTLPKD
jgi:serine/threonine protein kinase